ncbi:uncharacterized protein LOC130590240 [Beta vulgaris subsp. vulgaris]|uniref:uncharacterized protein LOC130590240 n=1 Tax=Beta vulgaris subsp. vulgaris TaxID=3555 RepID=UPI002549356D|nr:uncharacterized protein LOC130590240 [Beta vulgaris subsp. vulgaris]
MKIIAWNVRGASNNAFVPHAWDVVRFHNPSIFVIFETKAEECRARQVSKLLGFDDFKAMPPHGLKGGIWLMWKRNIDLVSWSEVSPYYFHSLFKFSPNQPEVLITGMHAPSTAKERHQIWRNMEQNLPPDQVPWMVVGDLNEVRNQGEKSGGRVFRPSQCNDLNSFMDAACWLTLGLMDLNGNWISDDLLLKNLARNAFIDIFTTKHYLSNRMPSFNSQIHVLHEESADLIKPFSIEEVGVIVKSMAPLKSPGPDGIQPIFYQQFWSTLNDHLVSFLNKCFDEGSVPNSINKSYLCLIPKKEVPSVINDFRPIGLCNTILKLLTKSIAARMRSIMPKLINPLQTSFILDRTIDENIIIIKEVAHLFKRAKKGANIMALKIDLTKAFDSLEWAFIRDTLLGFKFPIKLVSIIMNIITSPTISVLWNGEITSDFIPSRGIRQGDPLSPYIFVLCMERLSQLIQEKLNLNLWKPLMIAKDIGLSHLFYADDVFLFGKASWANMDVMLEVLRDFGKLSGLFLNNLKSTIIVPRKMDHNVRLSISSHCNLRVSSDFGSYLGIKISPNKLKKTDYQGLLDKTKDRIRGWQAKLLNMAGRCTLIKSVLNTYPLYAMQTNIIPMGVLDELQKNTKRFLWNKVGQRHYISRTSWSQVCYPMMAGGLGIRDLKRWNICFMAKLGWKFLTQPNKLWVQVLKAKYCKNSNLLDAMPNQSQSTIWRDILKGRDLLNKGLVYNVGNGEDISLWYHHWVGNEPLYKHPDINIPDSKAHWRVARIIRNGAWHLDSIISLLPHDIALSIKAIPLPKLAEIKDGLRWIFSKDGHFDIKSAYHCWLEIFVIAIWHIWKNRNKAVFDGAMIRSSTQYNQFLIDHLHNNDAFLKQNITKPRVSQAIVWRPPVHGYLKLNTDGAWKTNNKASGGGVIRRTDGSWFMGFSIKFDAINPAAAELATIREGLTMAKDHNISRLEVETDAQALKIMMDRAEKVPHHQLSAIICDIVKLIKTNWVVVFLHAKRDANMVAHKLARFGMEMEMDKVTHTAPPQCVLQEYMQELAYAELLDEENINVPAWFTFNSKDGENVVSGDSLLITIPWLFLLILEVVEDMALNSN